MKSSDSDCRIMAAVTEWEDNILFDADDPDFVNGNVNGVLLNGRHPGVGVTTTAVLNSVIFKVPSAAAMSMASLPSAAHLAELCSSLGRTSMSSSLSDLVGSPLEISADNIVTIEDLRVQMGSCFTCGVSWTEDHVSLDCSECGGYSMERPCPLCDGRCGNFWKRDFTMSHASGKAKWLGSCPTSTNSLSSNQTSSNNLVGMVGQAKMPTCAGASQLLAQELCSRLEKLSAQT